MTDNARRPLIHRLLETAPDGPGIEAMSLRIIDREAPAHGFTPDEWQIVRRMVRVCGDFGILAAIRFSGDAIAAGVAALRRCRPLVVDSPLVRAAISLPLLRGACEFYRKESLICHGADPDVARMARRTGLPRSLHAIQKARPFIDGSVALFGSAPLALLELNRMILEEGLRPSLVVAMPAGFVYAEEGKTELIELGVPWIAVTGRRGGGPLAVSVVHALCHLATTAVNAGPESAA